MSGMASNMSKTSTNAKSTWSRPRVTELGNLRDFVRSGQANGKSGAMVDGSSMAGNETMN